MVFAAFDHLKRRYDLIPDAFEVILEPENTDHWRGREIGLGLVAAAKRLRQAGFAPLASSLATATLMAVPGAGDLVTTFSYHRYDETDSALPQIKQRARKFGKETAMLEHLTGDAKELHADLTEADVSAWQQWGIAGQDGHGPATTAAVSISSTSKIQTSRNFGQAAAPRAVFQIHPHGCDANLGLDRIGAAAKRSPSETRTEPMSLW